MTAARFLRLSLLLSIVGVPLGTALAGSLSVTPTRIQMVPGSKPEVLRLRSGSPSPTLVQVEAVEWSDDVDSAAKAGEILAVPPVFTLRPDDEQVVRLALRGPMQVVSEKAYRLLITEVPQETGPRNALTFAVRLNLPFFVTPQDAAPRVMWDLETNADGFLVLNAANEGTAHLRVSELELAGQAVGEGTTYILAGESKSWPLKTPLSALPDVVEVRAETNRGPLVAQVPTRPQ